MSEQAFSLITLQSYWEHYQRRLLAAITPLSSEQFAFPVASHQTIGELLGHMIGARYWWFHAWMGEGDADLLSWAEHWGEEEQAKPDAASLATGFEKTWQMIASALSGWTAADLEHLVPPPASVAAKRSAHTREWIIWHVLEHEIHHGGELSLTLGGYGLQGVDI
jgi:uncharacterized damage-inducible protein DinB